MKDIEECVQICRNLAVLWEKGDYRDKQRVQKIAFPEGMYYSKKTDTVRTPRVNELIRVSSELSKVLGQKETGGSISFDASSRCVPRAGLEPTRYVTQWILKSSASTIPPSRQLRAKIILLGNGGTFLFLSVNFSLLRLRFLPAS
jgi:hypothetical protein